MANNDLKRVGLIFDAQGNVDFKQSLSSVNASLQENRNQFKLTKAQWDDSTKASDKLKDTQNYLSKQYEESTKKVSVLRSELAELENTENKDEKAIQKKKNALMTAETSLIHYKKGLEEVNIKIKAGTADIEEYAKKIQNFSDKTTKLGTSLTKNVTAPILAVGTAGLAAWNQMDEAYDNLIAGTGATGEALDMLQEQFDDVYSAMPAEAMDVSNAIADLNTRFGFVNDKLGESAKAFLEFATVNKTDVSTSIQLVSRAMGDAGIDAWEYQGVLDALTASSQASGISIETLTTNLAKYGAPMRALGYTTQESIAIFAQWEKAGVNTEIAFSGMKKAISNWAKEGKDGRVEFKKTLDEIKACPDIASATTKAIEVFGTKAGPDLADAIQGGRFEIEDMLNVVEDAGGIVSDSYNAMLDPADNAKIAMNNLTLAGAELGDVIQSALGPILETISDVLKNVTKWLKGLDDNTKTMIVTIGAILAVIGPLLVVFGTLAGSVSKVMMLYSQFSLASASATGASGLLGGALSGLTGPIMAVIAVVALIIGAIVQLWNTSDSFRTSIQESVSNIMSIMQNLYDTVLAPIFTKIGEIMTDVWENGIKPLWDSWVAFVEDITIKMGEFLNACMPVINWFIETFGPILVGIFNMVGSYIGNFITNTLSFFGAWLGNIQQIIGGIIQVFTGIIDFIVGIFTGDWEKAWDGVKSIFSGIFSTLEGVAKAPINGIIWLVNGVIGGINAMIDGINSISFTVPSWLPFGGTHVGFSFDHLGTIEYLAKGGDLLNGMAMVAEAGPELLLQRGNRTTVAPLTTGGGATPIDIIDYEKMAMVMVRAFRSVAVKINEDNVGEIIDERIIKAVG